MSSFWDAWTESGRTICVRIGLAEGLDSSSFGSLSLVQYAQDGREEPLELLTEEAPEAA